MTHLVESAKKKYQKTLYGSIKLPNLSKIENIRELRLELDCWINLSQVKAGSPPIVYWMLNSSGALIFKATLHLDRGFVLADPADEDEYLVVKVPKFDTELRQEGGVEICDASDNPIYTLKRREYGWNITENHTESVKNIKFIRKFHPCLWVETQCALNFDSHSYDLVFCCGTSKIVEASIFPRKFLIQGYDYNSFVLNFRNNRCGNGRTRLLAAGLTLALYLEKAAHNVKTVIEDCKEDWTFSEETEMMKDVLNVAKTSLFNLSGITHTPEINQLQSSSNWMVELNRSKSVNLAVSRFVFNNDADFDDIIFWVKDQSDECLVRAVIKPKLKGFLVQTSKGDDDLLQVCIPSDEDLKSEPDLIGYIKHECGAILQSIVKCGEKWMVVKEGLDDNEKYDLQVIQSLSASKWFKSVLRLNFDSHTYEIAHHNTAIGNIEPCVNEGNPAYQLNITNDCLIANPKLKTIILGMVLLMTLHYGYPQIRNLLKEDS